MNAATATRTSVSGLLRTATRTLQRRGQARGTHYDPGRGSVDVLGALRMASWDSDDPTTAAFTHPDADRAAMLLLTVVSPTYVPPTGDRSGAQVLCSVEDYHAHVVHLAELTDPLPLAETVLLLTRAAQQLDHLAGR